MKFTTQLELNITVKDPGAIYSMDYDQMLLDHAKILYEKKCRDGQYIQSIDKLVQRSLPNIIKRDLTSKIRVYIVVQVTAIRYDKYDFVDNLKIQKFINNGKIGSYNIIQCANDHVICLMKMTSSIEKFKIGDIIPVRVAQSIYKFGYSHIQLNAYQFLPYVPDPVYYSIGKLSTEIKTYFKNMIMPLFERELEKKKTLDQSRWNQFAAMIIPYKKSTKTIDGELDILDIESLQNKNIIIDYHIDLTKFKIASMTTRKASEDINIIIDEPKDVITRTAFEYIKIISLINSLTEKYTSDEDYNNISYIWEKYESSKF